MALSGCSGLQDALKDMFIETEMLEGANQYHCSSCNQLVNAKRVSSYNHDSMTAPCMYMYM